MRSSEHLAVIYDDDLLGQFDKALTALRQVECLKGPNISITTQAGNDGGLNIAKFYKKARLIAAIKQIAFYRYCDLRDRGLTEKADDVLWLHEDKEVRSLNDATLDSE